MCEHASVFTFPPYISIISRILNLSSFLLSVAYELHEVFLWDKSALDHKFPNIKIQITFIRP